jgi:hypothetical protein
MKTVGGAEYDQYFQFFMFATAYSGKKIKEFNLVFTSLDIDC